MRSIHYHCLSIEVDAVLQRVNRAFKTITLTLSLILLTTVLPTLLLTTDNAAAKPHPVLTPGNYSFSISLNGAERRDYLVHMPPLAAGGEPLPVVLNFHGAGSNARQEEGFSKMDPVADRRGFIAVYPNGTSRWPDHYTWNAGACCGYAMIRQVDDVAFVVALIDDLAARTRIDRRRVYATGMSNGAMMSYRLAAQASDHIAAIAPVAGSVVTRDFDPQRVMPIMAFNSVDDPLLHYSGGYGRQVSSLFHRKFGNPGVEEGLAKWREFDSCPDHPQVAPTLSAKPGGANAGITATKYIWGPCKEKTEIVLWKFTGIGHTWPGGIQNRFVTVLGRSTDLVDANEEMWKFFSGYELPQR